MRPLAAAWRWARRSPVDWRVVPPIGGEIVQETRAAPRTGAVLRALPLRFGTGAPLPRMAGAVLPPDARLHDPRTVFRCRAPDGDARRARDRRARRPRRRADRRKRLPRRTFGPLHRRRDLVPAHGPRRPRPAPRMAAPDEPPGLAWRHGAERRQRHRQLGPQLPRRRLVVPQGLRAA